MTENAKPTLNNNSLIISLIVAVVVGAGSFFAGMKYQQLQVTNRFTDMRNGGNGQFMERIGNQNGNQGSLPAGRQGFQPVNGEIISSDDSSITVKLPDGSSKIVLLSDSTSINEAKNRSKEDLKVGEKIMVSGTTNSDGSVSAQSIQLNPPDRVMPGQ